MGIETSRLDVMPPEVWSPHTGGMGEYDKWQIPGVAVTLSSLVLAGSALLPATAVADTCNTGSDGWTYCQADDGSYYAIPPDGAPGDQAPAQPPAEGADPEPPASDTPPPPEQQENHPKKHHHKKHSSTRSEDPRYVHTVNPRYWATQIIDEVHKGKRGHISASSTAMHTLKLTRDGKCSPIETRPGKCVMVKSTLLETLYKTSFLERFKINHITDADHVDCSDHFQGRGADLMRFDGRPPWDRSLLSVLGKTLVKIPGSKTAQLLGPGDPGHSGDNAHWHIGISGPNPIC